MHNSLNNGPQYHLLIYYDKWGLLGAEKFNSTYVKYDNERANMIYLWKYAIWSLMLLSKFSLIIYSIQFPGALHQSETNSVDDSAPLYIFYHFI